MPLDRRGSHGGEGEGASAQADRGEVGSPDAGATPADTNDTERGYEPMEPSASAPPPTQAGGESVDRDASDGPAGKAGPPATPTIGLQWGRFLVLEVLGSGGMGQVFKVLDPTLNRHVALKVLRGDDPELTARFLKEARAQARVDHENVCKVHEVGEERGRPYIVMQLIQGQPLHRAAAGMTLEQKVGVMKRVAEAAHSAHRMGLIHRDIKPSNIIVERAEDGGWTPYVLDFGLARETAAAGATVTGMVMGTPAYMAPEQARGEVRLLDRRTDVYGLGATFYEALCGHPPFGETPSMELFLKLLNEEPPPLRKREPEIPVDLETIVMRCLESSQHRRYDSAKALAEDLGRFLEGEPIEARRATWGYVLGKKARKHKAAVAASAIGLVAVAALLTMWMRARWQATEESRLAQRFGQDVERIDTIMRVAALLPLHDLRPEKALVRRAMERGEREAQVIGSLATGPGAYALGRGWLALEEYDRAQEQIDKAWKVGYRGSEVAYTLGLVYGLRYQQELDAVESIGNKDLRESRRKEIEKQLRDPAVEHLQESRGADLLAPEYAEGLIALYSKSYPVALRRANAAFKRLPWLYEAKLLEADAFTAMAGERRVAADFAAAKEALQRALESLAVATRIGESDPRCYLGQARAWNGLQRVGWGTGEDITTFTANAVAACEQALLADPESTEVSTRLSWIYWVAGDWALRTGKDATAAVAGALDAARRQLALKPNSAQGQYSLGRAWLLRGRAESLTGRDPEASFTSAVTGLERALELQPDVPSVINDLALAYWYRGQHELLHGKDPRASLNAASRRFGELLDRNAEFTNGYINLAGVLAHRGEWETTHGGDPRATLDKAVQVCESGLKVIPRSQDLLNTTGVVFLSRAWYEVGRGEDPQHSVDEALRYFQRTLEINPKMYMALYNAADVLGAVAKFQMIQGKDPTSTLSEARRRMKPVIEANALQTTSWSDMGSISLMEAEYLISKRGSPGVALADARAWGNKIIALDRSFGGAYKILAAADLLEVRWRAGHGQPTGDLLSHCLASLERAHAVGADDAETHRLLAEHHWRVAELLVRDRAAAISETEKGLAEAREALAVDPQAEALAITGALQLQGARLEREPLKRRQVARAAAETLERSVKLSSLVALEYRPLLQQALSIAQEKAGP